MNWRFLPILLVCFVFISPVDAQTADPIPPETIFGEAIDIRYNQLPTEQLPYAWNNDLRVFVIEGEVMRYPSTFERINRIEPLDESTYFISTSSRTQTGDMYFDWLFDTETNTISLFEDQCGFARGFYSPKKEHTWTLVTLEEGTSILCQRITGETSPPLTPDLYWMFYSSAGDMPFVHTSPDGNYVVFAGRQEESVFGNAGIGEFYSYQVSTGEILHLGTTTLDVDFYFERWLDMQLIFKTGSSNNIGSMSVLIVDATRADSLEFVISSASIAGVDYLENPPRYIRGFEQENTQIPCGRTTYDIQTRTITTLDLDGLCRPEYGDVEAVAYYRDVPSAPSYECCGFVPAQVAEVPLIRYDTRTGERTELYRGEIEQILWVSEDERYAILLVDGNGQIDIFPYLGDYDNEFVPDDFYPVIGLYDLAEGRPLIGALAEQYFSAYQFHFRDWAVQPGIYSRSQREFILITCALETHCRRRNNQAFIVTLDDGTVQETLIADNVIMPTPDHSGVFIWSNPLPDFNRGTQTGISIYDIASGETYPIITDSAAEEATIEMSTVDDQTVSITLSSYQTYRLKFDGSARPYVEIDLPPEPLLGEFICLLQTTTGVNLRVAAGGDQERFGTAERGETLWGIAQQISDNDGMMWFALESGGWVRSDFVWASSACANLPENSETNESNITELSAELPPVVTIDIEEITCAITVLTGVNLRSGPATTYEAIGSAAVDQLLMSNGQFFNTEDFFTWWRLTTGEWVRADFVAEAVECDSLPTISLEGLADELFVPDDQPFCTLTVIAGANLRSGAGTTFERVGSAGVDETLVATGQAYNAEEFFTWWQLNTSDWIREDFVSEDTRCESLPEITAENSTTD
ncbi:MAG: hypothetical protein RLP44_19515 [Aggregatilineales bacterium]